MTVNFIPKWKGLQFSSVKVGPDPEGRTFFVKTSLLVEISSNYNRFRSSLAELPAVSKDFDSAENLTKMMALMESAASSYAATLDSIGRLVEESLDVERLNSSLPEREATKIRMQKYASDLAAARAATRGLATTYQQYAALQGLGYASPESWRDFIVGLCMEIITSVRSAGVGLSYLHDLFKGSTNKEVHHLALGLPLYPLEPADIVSGRTYRICSRSGWMTVALFGPFWKDGFDFFRAANAADGPVILPDYSRRTWLWLPEEYESAVFDISPALNNNATTDDSSSAT